jgi:hypothetical protein
MLERHQRNRVLKLFLGVTVIEAGLFALSRLSPAMGSLLRTAAALVVIIFTIVIWRAVRGRDGSDRRHTDRRA